MRYVSAASDRASNKAYVHTIRAESALGRPLPPGAQVHHVDGDRANARARLVICQDQSYHGLLHTRARIVRAGGNPDRDAFCLECKQLVLRSDAHVKARGYKGREWALGYLCRPCVTRRNAFYRAKKRADYCVNAKEA